MKKNKTRWCIPQLRGNATASVSRVWLWHLTFAICLLSSVLDWTSCWSTAWKCRKARRKCQTKVRGSSAQLQRGSADSYWSVWFLNVLLKGVPEKMIHAFDLVFAQSLKMQINLFGTYTNKGLFFILKYFSGLFCALIDRTAKQQYATLPQPTASKTKLNDARWLGMGMINQWLIKIWVKFVSTKCNAT